MVFLKFLQVKVSAVFEAVPKERVAACAVYLLMWQVYYAPCRSLDLPANIASARLPFLGPILQSRPAGTRRGLPERYSSESFLKALELLSFFFVLRVTQLVLTFDRWS